MSNSEQKFKVGDKVVWKDKQYAKVWFRNTLDSVMTVVEIKGPGVAPLLVMDNGVEAWPIRFELYKEKEMPKFDLHKNPWYIRVENEEQFNLANEWLKENFGSSLSLPWEHTRAVVGITNTDRYNKAGKYLMWIQERHLSGKVFRYEVKLNFKTTISSVEYPVVEIETEQQKRIRELKETIDSASKQLEELMKETK